MPKTTGPIAFSKPEPLERRVLFSTINWVNRVTSDNFAVYGANTAIARSIVDRAIDDWERVIDNFNYAGGGNTFNLTLSGAMLGSGVRGSTSNTGNNAGKPTSATIQLDDNAAGAGWYFDPVPGTAATPDDSEFTSLITRFAASGGGAGYDFYRTTIHEIGHAMGISLNASLRLTTFSTNTGITDPVDGFSTLFSVNFGGGPVEATLTNSGGAHFFEGPAVGGLPIHPNDTLNAGRAIPSQHRRLISDLNVATLRDAYGYTVTLPSQINTFYANLNTTTGAVALRGDGSPADNIAVNPDAANYRFDVNGTGEPIPLASVNSITIDAGAGTDTIAVNHTEPGDTVSITSSSGNDTLGVNIDAAGSANVLIPSTQRFGAVTIGDGGRLELTAGGAKVLTVESLAIPGSGVLDLMDNDLIVDYTGASPLDTIRALISSARNGGDWLGAGITSSTARTNPSGSTTLGWMEALDYWSVAGMNAPFSGQPTNSTEVLVKHTWYGDADFNGVVNFDDTVAADLGFNSSLSGWINGDFDGSGAVDFDDFALLDLGFNAQSGVL